MPDPHGSGKAPQSLTRRHLLALLAALPAAGLAASAMPRPRHHLLVWQGWVLRAKDLSLVGSA